MKKKITIIFALALITAVVFAITACVDTSACQHRDANDNLLCDKCGVSFEDGEDLPDDPTCEHRDADDNSLCDECGESFEDGEDLPDNPTCEHRDADDNSLCDECGESFEDGKDLADDPTCEHRDADDNSLCDECGESFEDGDETDPHTHEYTVQNTDSKYLATAADCENAATYYYSCSCGDKGTETFAYGNVNGHSYTVKNTESKYFATAADCENAATYYYSCSCGNMGTEAFSHGEALGHNYVDNVCTECGDAVAVGAGLTFELNDDGEGYTLTGISTCTDTDLVIPDTYKDKPVTAIGASAFKNCTSLTSVTIPDNVTNISASAFYNCASLTSVIIGKKVESIGDYAFYNCTSLTNVIIPNSITSISNTAFYNCESIKFNKYYNACYLGNTMTPYLVLIKAEANSITSCTIHNSTKIINSDAFSNCTSLTSIIIGNKVEIIGDYAFRGCTSLTNVTIPDGVTSIGGSAFEYCTGLKTVTIGNSVTSIGDDAFSNCTSLTGVTIPDSVTSIGDSAFADCIDLTSVTIPDGVTSIGVSAFARCDNLASVKIGKAVERIGTNAFKDCTNLKGVYITDIGKWCDIAFEHYVSTATRASNPLTYAGNLYLNDDLVTELIIPDSVTSIGLGAFCGCTSIVSVTIPKNVTSIGYDAFKDCTSLSGVYINDIGTWCNIKFDNNFSNPLYIANNLYFNHELFTELIIPDGVTIISDFAFCGCTSIVSITIPESVTSMGYNAFINCYKLIEVINKSTINITNSYGSAGYYAREIHTGESKVVNQEGYIFYTYNDVNYLLGYSGDSEELILPDGYNGRGYEIFNYAFKKLAGITSVVIPESVTRICDSAFSGCSSLESITLPSVEFLAGSAPYASQVPFGYIFGTSSYEGGVATKQYLNTSGGSSTEIIYYIPTSLKFVTVTGGTIPYGVFYNCSGLASITLPNTITSISNCAFKNCTSLTSVTIPDSITRIGYEAFFHCDNLTTIIIGNKVESIGGSAFEYCTGLKTVTIGNSVTSIGDDAFSNCTSLTTVTIPDSVTTIGYDAFSNCTSLTSIKYRGTEDQWNDITKGSAWDYNTGSYEIEYEYDGE